MSNYKKHTIQTLIGQKGINLIEKTILEMGFVWHARTIDAGIDGMIELRNSETEEAYNFHILVQSKATERGFTNDKGNTFEFACDERDIDYWLKGNAPVILICSDVTKNEAYWKNVKEYFKDNKVRKERKVVFNKSLDSFDAGNKQKLIDLTAELNTGVYFSPAPKSEIIVSNLLPIFSLPDKIYFAKTDYRRKKELWTALNELADKKGINKNWMLSDEQIYSFNDLNVSPWASVVKGQVQSIETNKWAQTHDLAIKNNFIQLLNNTLESILHHKGLLHKINDEVNLFYFRPRLDKEQKPLSWKMYYKRGQRNSKQSVCEKYARKSDPTVISFYRHLAFEGKFDRYAEKWYLEITPTYYFTHDGFKMHYYYESKLKGKKALDKAQAVFSETLFWAYNLSKIDGSMFGQPVMRFSPLWNSVLEAGIDDDLWLKKEDKNQPEVSLTTQLRLVLK